MTPTIATMTIAGLHLRTDEQLAELTRTGYGQAFDVLVRRYRKELLSYSARYVGRSRAEDVVQETFVKALEAFQSSNKGSKQEHVRAWLYRVAHNTAVDVVRRKESEYDLLDEGNAGESSSVAAEAEQRDRVRSAFRVMSRLPDRERDALTMSDLQGRKLEDVAGVIGASPNAAKQLVYRARKRIRESCGMLIPAPFLRWMLERQGEIAASHGRTAELVAGGGSTGALIKVAAAMLIVGAPGAGVGVYLHDGHQSHKAGTAAASRPSTPAVASTATSPSSQVARFNRRNKDDQANSPTATTNAPASDPSEDADKPKNAEHDGPAPDPSANPARARTGPGTWSDGLVALSDWGDAKGNLDLATTQAGEMVAAWQSTDGANDRVRVAYGKADQGLSVTSLSSPNAQVGEPHVVADEQGGALVAWQDVDAGEASITYAERKPGADFSAPATLARVANGSSAQSLELAQNKHGDAVAAWLERPADDSSQNSVVRTAYRAAGGDFAPAQTVAAAARHASQPAVTISEGGAALVAWTANSDDDADRSVELARLEAGGNRQEVQTISNDSSSSDPAMAFDTNGSATIAWTEGTGRDASVVGTVMSGNGKLAATRQLSSPSLKASDASVAAAPAGGTLVTWLGRNPTSPDYRIQASARDQSGPLEAGVSVSDLSVERPNLDVSANASGDWLITWDSTNGVKRSVRTAYRMAGEKFMPFETLATGSLITDPRLSVDGEGTTVVIWRDARQLVARYR